MGQINGFTVRFSDGIKTADYAPPRLYDITANVTITDDDHADSVLLDTLTRIRRAGDAALRGRTAIEIPAPSGAPEAEVEGEPAPKRKRRTAAEIAADAALAKAAHPKGDPAAITEDEPPLEGGDPPSGGTADDFSIEGETPAADEFAVDGEEAEEITDAALNAAVQRKNAELSDPELIRGLIKKYNPDPTKAFQLREIPQEKRADFITKLGGLTKAA
ncbi:MAG TPA: hypothetical protein VKQ30_12535 [Ktedonobacterales bacterium]|nr:hypothetical protein [Ktedonobacterales bacterium]